MNDNTVIYQMDGNQIEYYDPNDPEIVPIPSPEPHYNPHIHNDPHNNPTLIFSSEETSSVKR